MMSKKTFALVAIVFSVGFMVGVGSVVEFSAMAAPEFIRNEAAYRRMENVKKIQAAITRVFDEDAINAIQGASPGLKKHLIDQNAILGEFFREHYGMDPAAP